MDAFQAIVSKRDTRTFRDDPVDEVVLGRVLQAARMAGSAKNGQLTRIVVATDRDVRKRLTACGDFARWIAKAPVILVFVIPIDGGRLFDVGRMAQNAMVAAHAMGLASCPVTFHNQDRIREALGVPDDHDAPMGVGVGWPSEAPSKVGSRLRQWAADQVQPRGARLPLEVLIHRDSW